MKYLKIVLFFFMIIAVSCNNHKADNKRDSKSASNKKTNYFVKRVIDGDTFVLEDDTRVRFIGIDTPETKHPRKPKQPYGQAASDFTRKMVEGKYVKLTFDKDRYDRYKRLLAYVYIDGVFLNAELVKRGLARATEYKPNVKFSNLFEKLENKAKADKVGMWSGRYMK